MRRKILASLLALVVFGVAVLVYTDLGRWAMKRVGMTSQDSVTSVLERHGPRVSAKFEPVCKAASIRWPPKRVTLLAFKDEKILEIWAADETGPHHFLASYPVLAASGKLGPKRKEGDRQVPEGIYDLPILNPNSKFHLSIRVDYPSADDLKHLEGPRDQMGGDIYIHGNSVSIGCLAMGDEAIEEIFWLVAQAPARKIIIAPVDFRTRQNEVENAQEAWVRDRYHEIQKQLQDFKTT